MRTPLGHEPLNKVARFRLSEEDLRRLRALSAEKGFSQTLRELINNAYSRRIEEIKGN